MPTCRVLFNFANLDLQRWLRYNCIEFLIDSIAIIISCISTLQRSLTCILAIQFSFHVYHFLATMLCSQFNSWADYEYSCYPSMFLAGYVDFVLQACTSHLHCHVMCGVLILRSNPIWRWLWIMVNLVEACGLIMFGGSERSSFLLE